MEENFASRLKLFIDSINVPTTQVADLCDIPRPSFSQLLSGRNQKVSDVLIRKIHKAFPDLSVMWLMFGEGSMLSSELKASEKTQAAEEIKQPGNGSEDSESRMNGRQVPEFSNVNGLTAPQNIPNDYIIQQLEENKKILELQLQIEKMQKNPRRVTHITVFYDDLTYDTFVPEK
ncbi:MAG: hypothetical protein K2H38_09110 [Muribaculaceae bacterium]|nr:hypothetical protein [Muribaculaceae bacterium]